MSHLCPAACGPLEGHGRGLLHRGLCTGAQDRGRTGTQVAMLRLVWSQGCVTPEVVQDLTRGCLALDGSNGNAHLTGGRTLKPKVET